MNVHTSSLYIHIPFCASKCYYCDFNSYVSNSETMERYLDALDFEMQQVASRYTYEPLKTVFFGGGTPTMLDTRQTYRMMEMLHRHFQLDPAVEISVESNPGTVDAEKLRALLDGGANRLSFGVQSFDNGLLKSLGRLHDQDTVYRSYEWARKAGFSSINFDLMFGLPGQTINDWAATIQRLLELEPEHVSTYSLKIEEGTPFYTWHERGRLVLPPEDTEVQMYDIIIDTMGRHGYQMYEISNFAKAGHDSKHNQVYWRNEPYLAVGSGAHGYVEGIRYVNEKSIPTYIDKCLAGTRPLIESQVIDDRIEREDTMMLGLRLMNGVSHERFLQRHGESIHDVFGDVVQSLVEKQLVLDDSTGIRLTRRALPVANEVFGAFLD